MTIAKPIPSTETDTGKTEPSYDLSTELFSKNKSLLQDNIGIQKKVVQYPFAILLYQPNYLLPFYYSSNIHIPEENPPDNQKLKQSEVKYQFSFQLPITKHLFRLDHREVGLNIAYTQLSYWQLYQKSAFFRETNYEPEIFLETNLRKNLLLRLGLNHQSNGQGGNLERSWNRLFLNANLGIGTYLISLQPWLIVFKAHSSDVYNPSIGKFLGYERMIVAKKIGESFEATLQLQNLEHFQTYMSEQATLSYHLNKHYLIYLQLFNGYGQSLIEYNHRTTSGGIGIALNDFL